VFVKLNAHILFKKAVSKKQSEINHLWE